MKAGPSVNLCYDQVTQELARQGIRLAKRRLQVVEYLCTHPGHPTVDEIHSALRPTLPTLSKTTVYNTLFLLQSAGLLRLLNIADNETRYDLITANHGHFKCDNCGEIVNFPLDIDAIPVPSLDQFQILQKDVYFKGICPKCRQNINKKSGRRSNGRND